MVFKILQGLCPKYFTGCFKFVCDSHGQNTRSSVFNLKQPNLKNKAGRSTFLDTGGRNGIKSQTKLNLLSLFLGHSVFETDVLKLTGF